MTGTLLPGINAPEIFKMKNITESQPCLFFDHFKKIRQSDPGL